MNQKRLWTLFFTLPLALLVILTSCATAPEVEEPLIEEPVVEEPIVEESIVEEPIDDTLVLEALARADASKEEALTYKAPQLALEEYNAAEVLYNEAKSAQEGIDFDRAIVSYDAATEKYAEATEISDSKIQEVYQALAKADASKEEALSYKAPQLAPDVYEAAEALYNEAKIAQEDIDFDRTLSAYNAASEKYSEATEISNSKIQEVYLALEKADTARAEAIRLKAPRSAPEAFNAAEALYNQAKTSQENVEYQQTLDGYEAAAAGYDLASQSSNSKKRVVEVAIVEADTYKQAAIDAKAPRAAAELYNEAEALYEEGTQANNDGDFEAAAEFFRLASDVYNQAVIEANIKKEEAMTALSEAEAALNRTRINADNAIIEGQEEGE